MADITFMPLMLATLADEPFSRQGWIFEPKLDGIRCLAIRNGSRVDLFSRNQLELTGRFPEIAEALLKQKPRRFAVDGEIVAFRGDVTSFEQLQQRSGPAFFYLFDLLKLESRDVREKGVLERKRLLADVFSFEDPIRLSEHRDTEGEQLFDEACRGGGEGVIAKNAASTYVGKRTRDWLKFKCLESQELVIGGWTEPAGARQEFGALLVGYYEKDAFRFAGKVGTGFDHKSLARIGRLLRKLEVKDSPFAREPGMPKLRVHWAKPGLVAQIAFHEWTAGGKLRQPRFQGLREDKAAKDVVRERKPRG